MTRSLGLPSLLAALAVAPAFAGDIGIADYEVTGARDTALVLDLDSAVGRTAEAVGACRQGGGTSASCLCASRSEIAGIRAALSDLLAVHPDWKGKTLFVRDTGNGQSLTIFLDALARQAAPPDCP